MGKQHRNTIFDEQAELVATTSYPGNQYLIRLQSPECARQAVPGQFVHVRCDDSIPMRRPLSILRADAQAGWLELLFKTPGAGMRALSRRQAGETVDLLGPIGNGFPRAAANEQPVLIGGGVGIPPLVFLAERLAAGSNTRPVVFFGSELPFPFDTQPSRLPVPGVPDGATHNVAMLDELDIPGRLASWADLPGCHKGFVTDLTSDWLEGLPATERSRCVVYACGPGPMLQAAQKVAQRYSLGSWLCTEEFMACAVGGCAGCAIPITTAAGVAMKRVCVDGPVFDGYTVYPNA